MKEIELKYGAKLLVPENVDARMVIAGTCCGGKTESFTFDLTKRKISIGQVYEISTGKYLLAQTGIRKVTLINVKSGHAWRWRTSVNDVGAITESEFKEVTGYDYEFTLVEDYDEC